MTICEKCWAKASLQATLRGVSVVDVYLELIRTETHDEKDAAK